jgi:hypothetical protein
MHVLIPHRVRHIPEQLKLARTPPLFLGHCVIRGCLFSIRRRFSSVIQSSSASIRRRFSSVISPSAAALLQFAAASPHSPSSSFNSPPLLLFAIRIRRRLSSVIPPFAAALLQFVVARFSSDILLYCTP